MSRAARAGIKGAPAASLRLPPSIRVARCVSLSLSPSPFPSPSPSPSLPPSIRVARCVSLSPFPPLPPCIRVAHCGSTRQVLSPSLARSLAAAGRPGPCMRPAAQGGCGARICWREVLRGEVARSSLRLCRCIGRSAAWREVLHMDRAGEKSCIC